MIKKFTIALPFLFYSPMPYASSFASNNDELIEIEQRYNIQTGVRTSDELLNNMIPVGASGQGYSIFKDNKNRYHSQSSYRFYMQDDQKTRVELSSLFVTDKDIAALSGDELAQQVNAKSLYHYGKGKATRNGDTWVYTYGLFIPKETNQQSQGIISQWHGIPDRTTVLAPDGEVTQYSPRDFNQHILTKMYFKKSIGRDRLTGKANSYYVDQGGYPPVTLKIGKGYLYVTVRSDKNRVTDKTDRINITPPVIGPKLSLAQTKSIVIPYAKLLTELPKEQWINLRWEIIWSDFYHTPSDNNNDEVAPGSVKLWMNGEQVLNWQGIVGNNDEYAPYFKYGIYKAGESGLTIQLAGFEQHLIKAK